MGSDDDERWVMAKGRDRAGHVVRRSEAIARIRVTDGGLYHWQLLGAPHAYGTTHTAAQAANAAREAWRGRER